jgi:hypothetical protein
MRRLKTLTSALVVALVVLTCIDYAASAATGHAFVLGKINKANRMTVLKRTSSGAALKLHTTSSATAPLVVTVAGRSPISTQIPSTASMRARCEPEPMCSPRL